MAQKDYVSRSKRANPQKRVANSRKKRVSTTSNNKILLLLILFLVVATFAFGLYYLKTNATPQPQMTIPTESNPKSTLPPVPEKRWIYIDALTNPDRIHDAHPNNAASTTPGVMTDEQKKILSLMEQDRPTANQQLPATYNQQVARTATNKVETPAVSTPVPQTPVEQTPVPVVKATPVPQPRIEEKPAPAVKPAESQRWMVQCGSFRNRDGAEAIKAQLAFSGFTSNIITSGGLHRVVVGPYSSKSAAASMQSRIKAAGVSNCNIRG